MEKARLLFVGIGGYASTHLGPILRGDRPDTEIVGCVDPYADVSGFLAPLRERGVSIFSDMAGFFDAGLSADLCIISTPIHLHARQMIAALEHGCCVMAEKPLCGDAADIPAMTAARDRAGKYVSIGYQWSYSAAVQAMKRDILSGRYGKPILLKTLVLWPRSRAYYRRGSGWAGRIRAADGSLILDSVANNATAHYLHNMLYVLGKTVDTAAAPLSVRASLWRANDIENYDTCSMEIECEGGGRALFIASHATERQQDPIFDYRFEHGRILYEEKEGSKIFRGITDDGTETVYGDPFADTLNKLFAAVDAVHDPQLRPLCGIEAATPHALVIAEAQKTPIRTFPAELIAEDKEGDRLFVRGLYESLTAAYGEGRFRDGL